MKKIALVLIVLGLLLGPAYWIHGKFFTGSEAALLTLKPAETRTDLMRIWRSEPFQLDQAMAPAGLVLLAQGHFSPNMDENRTPTDVYSATLMRDGVAAEPLKFSLGVKHVSDTNPAFREHLLLMQKIQPGQYSLAVTQAAEPAIQIDSMRLQIRQQLQEPDPDIVMAGIGLLALGLLVLVMG